MNNKNVDIKIDANNVLVVSSKLAEKIGLNESIVLTQIDFWLSMSNKWADGRKWVYKSIRDMQEEAFSFWSISTINRTINNLVNEEYLIEGNYSNIKYDKTRWLTINYELLKRN